MNIEGDEDNSELEFANYSFGDNFDFLNDDDNNLEEQLLSVKELGQNR